MSLDESSFLIPEFTTKVNFLLFITNCIVSEGASLHVPLFQTTGVSMAQYDPLS